MKLSFFMALVALFVNQVVALMSERTAEYVQRLKATPLLSPAAAVDSWVYGSLAVVFFLLIFTRLRREPGPLAAGTFLNGMGHVGLQVMALEWLKSVSPLFATYSVGAFAFVALVGAWRATRVKNEDESMALIAYFISVVAGIAFAFFVIANLHKVALTTNGLMVVGAMLGALPAYFSAKACATQVALIHPGGGRAQMKILALFAAGGLCGGLMVHGVILSIGVSYATVVVASVYLLAAWLFTQSRSTPFEAGLVPTV